MPVRSEPGREPPSTEPPVFVEAVLDPKPWGARNLARLGLDLPAGATIGEALFTAPQSRVVTGSHAGLTLGELARRDPATWIGERGMAATRGQRVFPLMVKVIDAQQDLSIQVHPTDDFAAGHDIGLGKTEAWHILTAGPGSTLYLGLTEGTDDAAFATACREGQGAAASCLRRMAAHQGATYLVPAGTPHAIGANVMIYEIQQPSTITYRLDDWGRVDASGFPRALHIDAGMAALDSLSRPEPVQVVTLQSASPRREFLAATRYFALERLSFMTGDDCRLDAVASPQVLTLTEGLLFVASGAWSAVLPPWHALVVPAGSGLDLRAAQPSLLLRGWVPDLDRDIVAPARRAGIPEESLATLGVHIGR